MPGLKTGEFPPDVAPTAPLLLIESGAGVGKTSPWSIHGRMIPDLQTLLLPTL